MLIAISLWLVVGPLALLQLGAWAWMLTSYSQESSFEQAVRETFSGERPCEMCKLVETVQENEGETSYPLNQNEQKDLKLVQSHWAHLHLQPPQPRRSHTHGQSRNYENPDQPVSSPPPREFV